MKHVSDPFVTLESTIDYLRHSRHTWTVFSFPFRMLPWFEYPLDLCLLLWLLIHDSIWKHNSFLPSFSVPNHPSPLPSFPSLTYKRLSEMKRPFLAKSSSSNEFASVMQCILGVCPSLFHPSLLHSLLMQRTAVFPNRSTLSFSISWFSVFPSAVIQ